MSVSPNGSSNFQRTVPLGQSIGEVGGHTVIVLGLELWDRWFDLRFARVWSGTGSPLPRRVPPANAWQVRDDVGNTYDVADAVGRGDRDFSNGEVRLVPTLALDATTLDITVDLGPGSLTATIPLDRGQTTPT